jgi:hypothetical protein
MQLLKAGKLRLMKKNFADFAAAEASNSAPCDAER